jgi:hypothetical protein
MVQTRRSMFTNDKKEDRMNTSRVSIVVLAAFWVLAVMGAVGRYFVQWEWWDFMMALASMAFAVGWIVTLAKSRPAPADLPVRAILGEPDFWGRAVLIFRHFLIGCALGVPPSLFRALASRLGQGGFTGGGIVVTSLLLYAVPMALLVIKRRLAQAGGYLFVAVLVPWIAASLA